MQPWLFICFGVLVGVLAGRTLWLALARREFRYAGGELIVSRAKHPIAYIVLIVTHVVLVLGLAGLQLFAIDTFLGAGLL